MGLSKKYNFDFYDMSNSFLDADLKEEVYVTPLIEFFSAGGTRRLGNYISPRRCRH